MGHEPFHNFLIGILNAAKITAETILVQLFVGLCIPQPTGIGTDFIGKDNLTVSSTAKFQLEIHQNNAAFQPKGFQKFVDLQRIAADCFNFFFRCYAQRQRMRGVQQGIAERIVL